MPLCGQCCGRSRLLKGSPRRTPNFWAAPRPPRLWAEHVGKCLLFASLQTNELVRPVHHALKQVEGLGRSVLLLFGWAGEGEAPLRSHMRYIVFPSGKKWSVLWMLSEFLASAGAFAASFEHQVRSEWFGAESVVW